MNCLLIPADPVLPVLIFEYRADRAMPDWLDIIARHANQPHSGIFDVVSAPGFDVWVDDEGLYLEPPMLNTRLVNLLQSHGYLGDVLVGDAIITGGAGPEGETLDLNDDEMAKITARIILLEIS